MKPVLVFDYDGTIHETMVIYEYAFRKCYKWLVSQHYVKENNISTEQIAGWLGMNSIDMWNSFQPDLSKDIKEQSSKIIGECMIEQIMKNKTRWYDGAQNVLNQLVMENYRMVVLSNCKTAYKEANWKAFKMQQWFSSFYDCETYCFAPKTEIIKNVQKENPGELIIIGDRKNDLECAKSCQAPFIGCLYGYGSRKELEGSDVQIESIMELPDAIEKINKTLFLYSEK